MQRAPLATIDIFDLAMADRRRGHRLILSRLDRRLLELERNFHVHRPREIRQ